MFPNILHLLQCFTERSVSQSTIDSSNGGKNLENPANPFWCGGGGLIVISDVDPHKLCILAWFEKVKLFPNKLPHGSFPQNGCGGGGW